jgi:4'-phosphopantetheinyl transferase
MLRSFPGAADYMNVGGPSAPTAALRLHGIEGHLLQVPPDAFPMWLVDASRSRPERVETMLSGAEQARALRYRNEALRDRYTIAHGSLRIILRYIYGVPVDVQELCENEFGKPFLSSFPQLHFSISYSAGYALIGVSEGSEIGVDIEAMRLIADADDLAELHYTTRERAELQANGPSEAETSRRFLGTWVKKEACVKAVGRGLGIPLSEVECGGGDQVTIVQLPDRQCYRTGIIQLGGDPIVGWARNVA